MDEDTIGMIVFAALCLITCLTIGITVTIFHGQTIELEKQKLQVEKYRIEMETVGEPLEELKLDE